jgi:hypothetical protein
MSELDLYKNIVLLGSGIDACIEKKYIGPALILIYSGIDTVGWLSSNEDYATRNSFMKWVDAYLLKEKPLQCTSLELYAARCGLLHTFTADSKLSSTGEARRICYSWGTGNVHDLHRTLQWAGNASEHVAVHVNDLYEAWRLGVLKFTDELEKTPERKRQVYKKADKFFSDLSLGVVQQVVSISQDQLNSRKETDVGGC